jgi:two-component system, cell cycle sensor histidine kinase and response regulator CckA
MKPEIVFGLENAGWPALLVDSSGKIQRANASALQALGALNEGSEHLSAIWSQENITPVSEFLETVEYSMARNSMLKFNSKDGSALSFLSYVCPFIKGNAKLFIFQLFRPPAAAAPAAKAKPEPPAVDPGLAHKQKLDCALQLARTVSLDFNNALTSILGHTSLLLGKADADHPWRNSLVEVEKSAAKAAEIANDLANFSRQEKDTRNQQFGNLNVLLQRCVDSFRTAENNHIEFTLQLERKLFSANFDEAKMQQAFVKIVENSVQAIGEKGSITVQSRNLDVTEAFEDRTVKLAPGNYICVEISDTGCGIPPDALPRIFEPFFTTKGKAHRGLGMAWVYGIVTNHGGGVAISSQPKVGTSARVYLPATQRIVKDSNIDLGDLCGVETVLMVDDEDLLLNMGQMVLSSYGYRALIASSGQKALEMLEQEPIDLVITDLVMPNMSGRELIEHIRNSAPATRIITSSGYVRAANSKEEESYLQKPFTAQELLRKVKEALSAPLPA